MQFFNRVTLRTPESVELEFTLAGIGNRTMALLVDYLVWGASLLVLLIVWGVLSVQLATYLESFTGDAQLWLTAIALLLTFAVYVGYFVLFETLWQGQTPGKRYAKIRVIREDGKPIGLSQASLRALLRPVDDTLFLGALMIMLGKREKRLGDWAAGTIVVQEERPVAAASFPIADEAHTLAKELLQTAAIAQLLPDDFAVVRDYLQRRSSMEQRARADLSIELARQVKHIIGLQQLPFKMTPDLFLEAIYLAYQQQSPEGHGY